MRFTVHLFAGARELARAETITIDLPEGATIADVRTALARAIPILTGLLSRSGIARNHDFADDDVILTRGDEIAVIPPVSGG